MFSDLFGQEKHLKQKYCWSNFQKYVLHTDISIENDFFLPNSLENRQGSGKVKEQNNPVYMHVYDSVYVFSKYN